MHLFCVLIGVVALVSTAVHAQSEDDAPAEETVALEVVAPAVYAPLSYDPYYVLPGGLGYTSVDIGVRSAPSTFKELKDVSDIVAMAKFNPHARVEVGAHLTFGFFKDGNSNFSSLVVGSKYQLGTNRAATVNIVLPAGDIGQSRLGRRSHAGLCALVLPSASILDCRSPDSKAMLRRGSSSISCSNQSKYFNEKFSAYLDLLLRSNTSDLEDDLSVRLEPNFDIGLGDGMVLNAGVSVDLQGEEREDMGLFIVLLRDM